MTKEIWLPVIGYENFYLVSDLGRVKSIRPRGNQGRPGGSFPRNKEGILAPGKNPDGYLQATLFDADAKRKRISISQLVLEAHKCKRPEGMIAGHKNAVRDDNRLSNLFWITEQQNIDQRTADGNTKFGENHGRARLTEDQAKEIFQKKGVVTQEKLAEQYKVSPATIAMIHCKINWKHIHKEESA